MSWLRAPIAIMRDNIIRNMILVSLSVYGYYALWDFARENGTFSMMSKQSSQNHLEGIDTVYSTTFTRIPRLDIFLKSLLTLFWPMVNGTQPGSSLMCFYFAGQGIAAWILTVVEGMRMVSRGKWGIISFTTTYGLLFQGIGIAVVGPLFLCFSPTGHQWSVIGFEGDISGLDAIPLSTISAIIIPTILMSLHSPTILTHQQKIDAIRLWQFFPLLFYIFQWLWTPVLRSGNATTRGSRESLEIQRNSLRRVYGFGICCAAIPHIGTWTLCFVATLFPHVFVGDVAGLFHPANLFIPTSPFSGAKATFLGQGTHWFLQWDMTLMFCMYLVWACCARLKVSVPEKPSLASLALYLLGYSIIFGPMGAALISIWERDEIVLRTAIQGLPAKKRYAQDLAQQTWMLRQGVEK